MIGRRSFLVGAASFPLSFLTYNGGEGIGNFAASLSWLKVVIGRREVERVRQITLHDGVTERGELCARVDRYVLPNYLFQSVV